VFFNVCRKGSGRIILEFLLLVLFTVIALYYTTCKLHGSKMLLSRKSLDVEVSYSPRVLYSGNYTVVSVVRIKNSLFCDVSL
jgi:hypothetical protein